MNKSTKARLIDGITVMCNPFSLILTVMLMFLLNIFRFEDFGIVMAIIALAYFFLSIVGGYLVKLEERENTKA